MVIFMVWRSGFYCMFCLRDVRINEKHECEHCGRVVF